jgi:ribosomal protein S18 acetylase RimI-like enzyme
MSAVIRAAGVDDVRAVLALWREADAEPSHTDDVASLERLITHDAGSLMVAEVDQRIIGTVIAGWDGWRGSIYRLVVAPSHRRAGLGRQLVGSAQERLSTVGASRLQAIVVETDGQATGFWKASGWEQQAERLRFVKG